MSRIFGFAVLVVLGLATTAAAQGQAFDLVCARVASPATVDPHVLTVKGLMWHCRANDLASRNQCAAYVVGAADMLTVLGNSGSKNGLCSTNYETEQLPLLFTAWADRHIDMQGAPALAGVRARQAVSALERGSP